MTEIRVLIADDHAVLRSGLKLLIRTQPDMVVVGEAGDFPSARKKIIELRPNVVTLDLSMPGGDAVKVIEDLTREIPETRLVILTMHDDASMFRAAFAAGAAGYVVKSAADTELLTAIRTVAAGRIHRRHCRRRPRIVADEIDAGLSDDICRCRTGRICRSAVLARLLVDTGGATANETRPHQAWGNESRPTRTTVAGADSLPGQTCVAQGRQRRTTQPGSDV